MFKALLAQIPEMPDVLFDFVGGWPHLIAKDQQTFEPGCKEAFVVLERYGMVDEYLKDSQTGAPLYSKKSNERVVGRDLTPFSATPPLLIITNYGT